MNDTYISTSGKTQAITGSLLVTAETSRLFDTFQLTVYENDDSILNTFFSSKHSEVDPMLLLSEVQPILGQV